MNHENQIKNNSLMFRIGIIAGFVGGFLMFIDSFIEYPTESLTYLLRPCYIIGMMFVITALVILFIIVESE